MSNIGTHRKFGSLELTVFEYFVDMDTVHVHCKRQINMENVTRYPRSFVKHLVANAGMLENKPHSLYYEVPPPFRTIMSLDDNSISIQTFLEWFHRNVNNVYAVIANSATSDFEKVCCTCVVEYYTDNCNLANNRFFFF